MVHRYPTMEEINQAEDAYQNLVKCFTECSGIIENAQKLYFERYGVEPSPEDVSKAIAENYEEG